MAEELESANAPGGTDVENSETVMASPEGGIVFCDKCGAKNTAGDKFCSECGAVMAAAGELPPASPMSRRTKIIAGVVVTAALAGIVAYVAIKKPAGPGGDNVLNQIHELKVEGDVVWAGSTGGVVKYDRKKGKKLGDPITSKEGLSHDFIEAVYVDRKGVKWFGTLGGGITIYDGKNYLKYDAATTNGAFGEDTIHEITQDHNGTFWIAGGKTGVYSFDGNVWKNYTVKDGLPSAEVNWVAEDTDHAIWACTNGGVARMDPKTKKWKAYTVKDGLVNNQVWSVVIDGLGVKWFGTWGGGISKFDGTNWITIPGGDNGPSSGFVFCGQMDKDGNLWFGTYEGASMWDGTKWSHFKAQHGLLGSDVYDIAIDVDGNKWFGTYQGVSRLDKTNKKWKTMSY